MKLFDPHFLAYGTVVDSRVYKQINPIVCVCMQSTEELCKDEHNYANSTIKNINLNVSFEVVRITSS